MSLPTTKTHNVVPSTHKETIDAKVFEDGIYSDGDSENDTHECFTNKEKIVVVEDGMSSDSGPEDDIQHRNVDNGEKPDRLAFGDGMYSDSSLQDIFSDSDGSYADPDYAYTHNDAYSEDAVSDSEEGEDIFSDSDDEEDMVGDSDDEEEIAANTVEDNAFNTDTCMLPDNSCAIYGRIVHLVDGVITTFKTGIDYDGNNAKLPDKSVLIMGVIYIISEYDDSYRVLD